MQTHANFEAFTSSEERRGARTSNVQMLESQDTSIGATLSEVAAELLPAAATGGLAAAPPRPIALVDPLGPSVVVAALALAALVGTWGPSSSSSSSSNSRSPTKHISENTPMCSSAVAYLLWAAIHLSKQYWLYVVSKLANLQQLLCVVHMH